MNEQSFPLWLIEIEGFPVTKALLDSITVHSGSTLTIFLSSVLPGARERADAEGLIWLGTPGATMPDLTAKGFFLLASDRLPQPHWDTILRNGAQASPHCGTVSPLHNDFLDIPSIGTAENMNAFLWAHEKQVAESLDCDPGCCFVTPAGAAVLHRHPSGTMPERIQQSIRQNGRVHLLHANLVVPSRRVSTSPIWTVPPALYAWRHMLNDKLAQGIIYRNAPGHDSRPVTLHVIHSWGGGLEKWCRDFCRHDQARCNIVLRSVGTWGAFGQCLELFSDLDDPGPLATWHLPCPIRATDIHNLGYAEAVREIVTQFAVDIIIVSSLIGHSLDILRTSLPTVHVVHDYYPFCPTISTHSHQSTCTTCSPEDLARCHASGKMHAFFTNIDDGEWTLLRSAYFQAMGAEQNRLITPTPAAERHLKELDARYESLPFTHIEHGSEPLGRIPVDLHVAPSAGKRVLILGEIRPEKGEGLLRDIIPRLSRCADIFLVGCGEGGSRFAAMPGVHIIKRYTLQELGTLLDAIEPDLALLPSTCPETFSYTLTELFQARIPVLATNLGSFAARIDHGRTGFLCAPLPDQMFTAARDLLNQDDALRMVRENLSRVRIKTVAEMIREYNALLPVPRRDPARVLPKIMTAPTAVHLTHTISPGMRLSEYLRASHDYLRQKEPIYKQQSRSKVVLCRIMLFAFRMLTRLVK